MMKAKRLTEYAKKMIIEEVNKMTDIPFSMWTGDLDGNWKMNITYTKKTEKPKKDQMTPTEYKAERQKLLDDAYDYANQGERYNHEHTLGKVSKLDAEYAEQCRGTMKEDKND